MIRTLLFTLLLTNVYFAQDSLVFVIRVDDIYSRNTTYPAGILPFQQTVEQRGGKVTWAVMPHRLIENMNLSGKLSAELRSTALAGHEISQHGYIHICQQCGQSSHEMYCVTQGLHFTYQQQLELIRQGLKLLRDSVGVVPVTFVPPGHQADSVTYQVLLDSSFQFISTTGATKQNIYKELYNLAPHNEYTWQMTPEQYSSRMSSALADIRAKAASQGYYCVLLHDPFIRPAYQDSIVLRWTGELLDSLNAFFGSKIRYRTLSEAAASFRGPLSRINQELSLMPDDMAILQNYPNPFNPETRIRYKVIKDGFVTMNIYDISGKALKTIVSDELSAGWYEITFNGSELSSGVYFINLVQKLHSTHHKLLLLK